jgi:hypothetical protein
MRRLAAVTLHKRLERDVLLRQSLGDGRGGARFVYRAQRTLAVFANDERM